MPGFTFSMLAVLLSFTEVFSQEHFLADKGTLVGNTKQAAELFVPTPEPRNVIFRPLIVTRQRNRDFEKFLTEQRRRYKLKKSSNRNSAHKRRLPKSQWTSTQYEIWAEEPNQHFENQRTVLPQAAEDRQFLLYPAAGKQIPVEAPASKQQTRLALSLGSIENVNPNQNPAMHLISRPRRNVKSNSSQVHQPLAAKSDADDVRPSSSMMLMFSEPVSNSLISDAPESSSTAMKDDSKQKSSDEESMETAESVIFHPLFVHRLRKADRIRRRQLQMRRQNRPQKPQRQQSRPQQRPTTKPQQRPQSRPQQTRPQKPVQSASQKKKPQSTRRGQYYYVAAAGPLGQWFYYPYYYV